MSRLSGDLKSKNEENEAYLSEIEVNFFVSMGSASCTIVNLVQYLSLIFFFQTIGQAYDDMQTQNQHLLQQITERDDYNIKVNGLRNCVHDVLLIFFIVQRFFYHDIRMNKDENFICPPLCLYYCRSYKCMTF